MIQAQYPIKLEHTSYAPGDEIPSGVLLGWPATALKANLSLGRIVDTTGKLRSETVTEFLRTGGTFAKTTDVEVPRHNEKSGIETSGARAGATDKKEGCECGKEFTSIRALKVHRHKAHATKTN